MIAQQIIKTGVVHRIPSDLREVLLTHNDVLALWNGLTPLARNEWICWVTIVKKPKTRQAHLQRLSEGLRSGKRRPCCWPGCKHRQKFEKSNQGQTAFTSDDILLRNN